MGLNNGLQIARIRGIAILVHWSWILIFTLITWTLSVFFGEALEGWSETQAWIAAVVTALAFFCSVLLHEFAHAMVAQGYGLPVPSITLFIFGGVSNIAAEMKSARQEFFIAVAGPAMSIFLSLVFGVASFIAGGNVGMILFYLAFINGLLGIFNLLPGFPLDGGRVFRSIVWGRTRDLVSATRIASRVGQGIAWFMILGGVLFVITVNLTGLWYIFIGLFLKQAAEASYQQLLVERALARVKARDLMRQPPEPMPETSSLQVLVDERILASGDRCVLLERNGRISGIITTTDLAKIPRDQWVTTSARTAMVPAEDVATVAPSTSATEAVRLMTERDIHQLPVIEDGQLVGLLTRGDILNHIQQRMQFADLDRVEESARKD